MIPYGKTKRMWKIHPHNECGVCSENKWTKSTARHQAIKDINKEVELMSDVPIEEVIVFHEARMAEEPRQFMKDVLKETIRRLKDGVAVEHAENFLVDCNKVYHGLPVARRR
jgi:hypothetical protein